MSFPDAAFAILQYSRIDKMLPVPILTIRTLPSGANDGQGTSHYQIGREYMDSSTNNCSVLRLACHLQSSKYIFKKFRILYGLACGRHFEPLLPESCPTSHGMHEYECMHYSAVYHVSKRSYSPLFEPSYLTTRYLHIALVLLEDDMLGNGFLPWDKLPQLILPTWAVCHSRSSSNRTAKKSATREKRISSRSMNPNACHTESTILKTWMTRAVYQCPDSECRQRRRKIAVLCSESGSVGRVEHIRADTLRL
ncbi:hypothetical protein Moror_7514 [Moniliophthora roreri MCA 2997]|uniref:Uncharacterized protein n=1 Tax=Moniliophthora roreri (strain MCA 2997) TaxID=1381753 RepID=V2WAY4_MONRO|nr:hypothetical protein Moror_7514 [Moniliophthora roreri MCA 2997]